ncbi:MAG: DUF4097 domain-containing protein [Clostridiales bacterium]|nr:DUF4097 domain-containing protein [Clostridiales bacterium]
MKKAIIITLVSVLSLGLILTGTGLILTKGDLSQIFKKDVRTEMKVDETAVVSSLTLSVASDDIKLYPSPDTFLHIEYWDSENYPFEYSFQDGKAQLIQKNDISQWFNWAIREEKTVKVYCPVSLTNTLSITLSSGTLEDMDSSISCSKIEIDISSGDVTLKPSQTDSFEADIASGSLKIDGLTSSNASINVSSGSFDMTNSTITGALDITISSGDAKIEDSSINTLESQLTSGSLNSNRISINSADCVTTSGDITLRLTSSGSNYSVNIDIVSGQALINDGVQNIQSSSGLNWGTGEQSIYCKTTSGDVKIYFAAN